ncbi:MAG: fascin domain-containing protein [Candidatus Poseidoniaceae archaeon]
MAGDLKHIHDPVKAEEFARALGLQIGGAGHPFVGHWETKGLCAYSSGKYSGMAYFGTGGSERDRLTMPHESEKYRPWNRYDPDIPDHIRKKLIDLEDDDSTSIGQPHHARTEPSRNQPARTETSPTPMPPSVSVSDAGSQEVNGTYVFEPGEHDNRHWGTIAGHYQHTQNPEIFIAFQDCGAGQNRPDWNKWMIISKIGVLYAAHTGGKNGVPPRDGGWETVDSWGNPGAPGGKHPAPTVRHGDQDSSAATRIQEHTSSIDIAEGKIALKSVHGKYLSAQPDGRAEWNRDIANEWEYFHLEKRQGGKITLRGAHGMYVSAQPDGEVQINRQAAPPTGWEEFTVEDRGNNAVCLKSIHGKYLSAQMDGTAQWNRDSAPKGGWEDIQVVYPGAPGGQTSDAATKIQEHAPAVRQESIEILEAIAGKPVRFKIHNRPSSNDAWVGIYPTNASDQEHGEHNKRWKWLRDIDVNNASFPKQAVGSHSIRVFSDGGHTLHERKDFTVEAVKAEPLDPVAVKSTRKKACTALAIGLLLLAPGIPLFVLGLGGGFQHEGVSSGTFEIEDADGQGDWGFEIFIEGAPGDFNGNGMHDYCEYFTEEVNLSAVWTAENSPGESRQVFYVEIAHEGSGDCGSHHHPKEVHHNGTQLVKIGRACSGCHQGTTTITAQNQQGDEVLMWIKTEENQEKLGMLIPGAIMMGIGAFLFVVSLIIIIKLGRTGVRSQTTFGDSNNIGGNPPDAGNWFAELSKQSKEIEDKIASGEKPSNHDRVMEEMKFPDKSKVEMDIKYGSPLGKWHSHLFNDPAKSAIIARELGLQVGGAGYEFEGKWKDKGLFAYHTGKYAGCAYFGIGGTSDEELEQKGGGEKYRPWEVKDPNMPNDVREAWRKIEPILARSYYLNPTNSS